MIAYAGQNRRETGRYKQHTMKKVFAIYRPK